MHNLHPQFFVDEGQSPRSVLLPYDEWMQIVEALEELDDLRAYDEVRAQSSDPLPFEDAVKEIRRGGVK